MAATGGARRVSQLIRRRGLVHLAQLGLFLAVEAGWLFGWSAALGVWIDPGRPDPLLGLPGIAGLLAAGAAATRLAMGRLRPLRLAQLAVALLGLGLATLPIAGALLPVLLQAGSGDAWSRIGGREAGAWALTLLVWWRGLAAGRARLTLDSVEAGFRWGVIALIGLFLLGGPASAGSSGLLDTLIGSALLTLFAGLVGLPLARILDLSEGPRHRTDSQLTVGRHWLTMLLGAVGVLLAVTLVLASTLTFERIDRLVRPLAWPLSALLWGLLYLVAVPVGLLIEGLVYLFRLLVRPVGQPVAPEPPDLSWVEELRRGGQGGAPPELLLLILKWALVAGAAALVVWLLARAVFRFADWSSADDVDEERDFIWSWGGLRAAIVGRLRSIFSRRAPAPRVEVRLVEPPGGPGRSVWDAREVYRELLRLGMRLGRRRARSETPQEYERVLADMAPLDGGQEDLRVLTEVYSQARYDAEPPGIVALTAARKALERLRELTSWA